MSTKKVKRGVSGVTGKKKGVTPESSVRNTPTGSTDSVAEPKNIVDEVLDNEEVAALCIKEEDLIKLHPPKPPSNGSTLTQCTRKVLVRETCPSSPQDRHKLKKVGVLQPLPPGTVVPPSKQLVGSVSPGPRFNDDGTFIAHSILGTAEDFAKELKEANMMESVGNLIQGPTIIQPKIDKLSRIIEMSYKDTILPRDEHALQHWEQSMEMRRSEQQYLADKLEVEPEKLAMNRGEYYRRVQEERKIIDHHGKEYRVVYQFWKLPERIGDEETGLHMTLTQTEKGLPPEMEFVGIPSIIHSEKGTESINVEDKQGNAPLQATWHDSEYLSHRRNDQKDPLHSLNLFRPDISELQVVGRGPGALNGQGSVNIEVPSSRRFRMRIDSLDSLGEERDREEVGGEEGGGEESASSATFVTKEMTTSHQQQLMGPALRVCNTLLKWMGPPPSTMQLSPPLLMNRRTKSDIALTGTDLQLPKMKGRKVSESMADLFWRGDGLAEQERVEVRVNLQSDAGIVTTSYLNMENCGTTAVYFSWEAISKPNPLQIVQAGDTQRFYFDTRGGVLLPDQKLDFPFVFKSHNPGIFTEKWLLSTRPVLNQGRPLIITLNGVATREDVNKEKRDEIERILAHREAEATAERIVQRLVESIRTPPPHSASLRKTIVMEEDIFREKNPEMYYHYNIVQQLKHLHDATLRPALYEEMDPLAYGSVAKSERSGGKKGDDKTGGRRSEDKGRKGDHEKGSGSSSRKGEEKKGSKEKKKLKEELEVNTEFVQWDLSVDSLLEIIMNVEEKVIREEKLKQLNQLVGELSFPPYPPLKSSSFQLCYQTLCGAVDSIADISAHLCHVMGMPPRDWIVGEKRSIDSSDSQKINIPISPAPTKPKLDKKTSKDKKERKPQALTPTTSKTSKKGSKRMSSPHGNIKVEQLKEECETTTAQTEADTKIDPILEMKYKENFYVAVHRVLELMVDRMAVLIDGGM